MLHDKCVAVLAILTLLIFYVHKQQSNFTANEIYSKEVEARRNQGLLDYQLRMQYCNGRSERPPVISPFSLRNI